VGKLCFGPSAAEPIAGSAAVRRSSFKHVRHNNLAAFAITKSVFLSLEFRSALANPPIVQLFHGVELAVSPISSRRALAMVSRRAFDLFMRCWRSFHIQLTEFSRRCCFQKVDFLL